MTLQTLRDWTNKYQRVWDETDRIAFFELFRELVSARGFLYEKEGTEYLDHSRLEDQVFAHCGWASAEWIVPSANPLYIKLNLAMREPYWRTEAYISEMTLYRYLHPRSPHFTEQMTFPVFKALFFTLDTLQPLTDNEKERFFTLAGYDRFKGVVFEADDFQPRSPESTAHTRNILLSLVKAAGFETYEDIAAAVPKGYAQITAVAVKRHLGHTREVVTLSFNQTEAIFMAALHGPTAENISPEQVTLLSLWSGFPFDKAYSERVAVSLPERHLPPR